MKLLIDMNLSPDWVKAFMHQGIEALHWSTIGAQNAPDTDLMAYATANGFHVLTNDLDFGAILAATAARAPSVVQLRGGDLLPESIGPQVMRALRQTAVELAQGALVTVDARRVRVRVLPFSAVGRESP